MQLASPTQPVTTHRNNHPQRTYDKDGQKIKPATVGSQAALGLRCVEIFCNDCNHSRGGINVNDLPPEISIPDVCLRYVCSRPALKTS